jgi:hypothetical protein
MRSVFLRRRPVRIACFVVASVVTPLGSFVTTRILFRVPAFPEFTAVTSVENTSGAEGDRVTSFFTHIQRSDGSTADFYSPPKNSARSFVVRQIRNITNRTRTTLTVNPGAEFKARVAEGEIRQVTRQTQVCSSERSEISQMHGYQVVRVRAATGGGLLEEWQAPRLSCFPLESTMTVLRNGVVVKRVRKSVTMLQAGAPEPTHLRDVH